LGISIVLSHLQLTLPGLSAPELPINQHFLRRNTLTDPTKPRPGGQGRIPNDARFGKEREGYCHVDEDFSIAQVIACYMLPFAYTIGRAAKPCDRRDFDNNRSFFMSIMP